MRYRGKERPIRCEGEPALAVRLGSVWRCARCGSVIRQVYVAPGRTDLDGMHSSVRCPDYASPLHVRTSLAAPAARADGAVADDPARVAVQLGAVASQPDGPDADVVPHVM